MLNSNQKKFLEIFYEKEPGKLIYTKKQRDLLWDAATKRKLDIQKLEAECTSPALFHQIVKSYQTGNNIQSAVFSECVYAQTLAILFGLNDFYNCLDTNISFISDISHILTEHYITPRYVYENSEKTLILIQARGCGGIDAILIKQPTLDFYTIEFKEPGAKTSEPDLPKYKENGNILITDKWISEHPHFKKMLLEQKDLNFFEVMGRNINDFSQESIEYAVTNNYQVNSKQADIVITEDIDGILTAIPANEVKHWAKLEGEIRPAGRNNYKTWTPLALIKFLVEVGAEISGSTVYIQKDKLKPRKQRGNSEKISGYKITPLFFIRKEKCKEEDGLLRFELSEIRQLNPTIAGKMFFLDLKYENVKQKYTEKQITRLKL